MRFTAISFALAPVLAVLFASPTNAIEIDSIWGVICSTTTGYHGYPVTRAALARGPVTPVAHCGAVPSGFRTLPSVGTDGDTSVSLKIGYDPDTDRLCYLATSLPEAPVLRVGVGHTLTITITNTLHDTGTSHQFNCPIDVFGGEGRCVPLRHFAEQPGPDGRFYPIMANEAHTADGTSNLHVHGLFVSPQPCSDEVLRSAIYPANWGGPIAPTPVCQTAPNTLTYMYHLPANHPAGLYWYHTHRHGQSEQETQMGLAGAIVVEDRGDMYRRRIGVTDEVLVVDDTPKKGCLIGVSCDARGRQMSTSRDAARRGAESMPATTATSAAQPILDPRIDQKNQAGECAQGAYDKSGGTELWTLVLNGAQVPENLDGSSPPDSELLSKTMRPGQRQIFRLVNAAADSFIAPKLVLSRNGVETVQKLEVFARDGVGLADSQGNRRFGLFDVAKTKFIVPPASRVEFVVHAPPVGAKLYLQSDQVDPGCGGNAYPARRLLKITAAGAPVNPGAPDDSDLLKNTPSLHPYFSTLNDPPSVHRTFVFAEYGRNFTYSMTKWLTGPPTMSDYNPGLTDFYITEVASDYGEVNPKLTALRPFVAGDLTPQVVVHLRGKDRVTEEWLVENSTLEIHAFHMHQIHFRDVTVNSANPNLQPILDTIDLPAAPLVGDVSSGHPGAPGWVKLRMTFTKADIGEFVFHCHILEHEDNGMMSKIQVVSD
jgi:FtsP/CotA-like multicopper oxidase with cupredoxin domain